MVRQPVTSSNLKSVGFDSFTQTLEIEFRNRSVYQYALVPAEIYAALMQASSKGRFFDHRIRAYFRTIRVK